MSFLFTQPEFLRSAATDLAGVGSTINAATSAAAGPTTEVLAAGADEVSMAMATIFGAHAQSYQVLSTQAARFHNRFVSLLNSAGGAYSSAEFANVRVQALNVIGAPTLLR
ncbi:PE family protein [Mycobacterium sp. ML4]